jgi:hypothetical protein
MWDAGHLCPDEYPAIAMRQEQECLACHALTIKEIHPLYDDIPDNRHLLAVSIILKIVSGRLLVEIRREC